MSMSKSPDTAQQIKYITSVFRALITSRKQPCTLREILREYPEVESKPINYTKLGFKSVEDLLRESGDFVLTKLGGETCIAAKYSKNSSHIALMVRGQKSSSSSSNSKSNKTNKKAQVRQPQRPADQSWNKSSYSSNVYQKLPPSLNRFIVSQNSMNGDNNNNTNQINNRNAQQKQLNAGNRSLQTVGAGQKDLRDKLNTKKDVKMMANGKQQQLPQQQSGIDLRDKINTKQNTQQQQQHQYQQQNKNKNGPRAILGQNNNANGVQQQHQQHRQQSNPCDHLQNSNAISIASSLILAQRQQQAMHQQMQPSSRHSQSQPHNQRMQQQQQQMQQQQQQQMQQQQQQQKRHQSSSQSQPQPQQQQQKSHQQNSLANPAQINMKPNKPPQQQLQMQQQQQQPQYAGIGKNSVQDRLRIKLTNNNYNASNNFNVGAGNGSIGATPESSPVPSSAGSEQNMPNPFGDRKHVIKNETQETQQIIPPKVFQFNPKLDPITSLSQYCVVRRCLQPEYSFFRSKFTKLFQCRVLVNGSIYSTYPNEYPSEQTAKFSCAAMAIEEIKVQECRRHLPICPDNDYELTMKIYQELKSHPHGIFAKNLPEWFENTFEQLLPDHWWSLIEGSKQFVTETTASDSLIIFANNDFENGDNLESESESFTMDAISLPWENKYWNLYVTHCVSTIEIWGRLFGKQYSDQFDNLMNDIDVYMLTEKVRPVSVACKQIYLVCISECWHRVRLDEVDKLNGIGLCFFIDFGDEDWVPVCQLYICEKKFLKLAPQAVSFSLFGLEDFTGNPNAKRHLDGMLSSKSVVGEILTKEDVYQAGVAEGNVFRIQVVLYDTSSQEDVNLNPLILHQICDDTPPPEIKRTGLTNVLITHITDAGDVFLQVRNSELQYVQKLIQQLIESKFKEDQHKVSRGDIQRSNLFLICDKATNQWYRGALATTTNILDDEEFDIFYIDNGMTKRTHISNMFQLESLSTALSKFPRQGIKAKLDNIPSITPGIVARMRGLLPADSRALVKIGTPSVVPFIVVYKRFEGSETLCNVNEVIRIEQELESSNSDLLDENGSTSPNDCKSLGGGSSGGLPSPGTSSRNSSSVDLNQTFRSLTIKTNSVPNSPQKSDYMLKLRNYDEVPSVGEFFDVRVTMSANPCNFMVQPYKNFPELRKLMKDLQDYCANNDEFIPVDMVEKGQAYAGKNKDGFYHRVVVVNIYQEMIHVSFCDFGDVDILRSDQLKTLPAKFRQLPKQAIQAKLHGISACNVDWTMEDCLRFRELTVGQKFVSVIKKVTDGDKISPQTRILELDLIDVQTDDDIYIREILLKEGRALETTGE